MASLRREIAKANHWTVERYTLRVYDALRDSESPQYRRRQSQRRDDATDTEGLPTPAFRLLGRQQGADSSAPIKTCDVYRESSSAAWLEADASISGVALHFHGNGVLARLGNEHGIMHFIDTGTTGPKRRQRFRVAVEEARMIDIDMPSNWTEQGTTPLRDPRRAFS